MANAYELVAASSDETVFDVVLEATRIGQVGLVDGSWHLRLEPMSPWSKDAYGSEFEASEIVLVERGLLKLGPGGVAMSSVTVRK
jgi:hypothetical protein